MRQWKFVSDMNFDGAVTISDVGLWLKWLFFMPGDALMFAAMDSPAGRFFEVTPSSYGGIWSGIVSLLTWLLFISLLGSVLSSLAPLLPGASHVSRTEWEDEASEQETRERQETSKERIARERQEDLARPWWMRRYHYDGWIAVGALLAIAVILLVLAVKAWLVAR
jgi:hypothetical protein